MCDMAVNAAVRYQTVQMQIGIILFAVLDCLEQLGIFKEIAVLDFLGDTGKILINDAACAHVQVSYLGIAHLSVGKSDKHTRSIASLKGIFLHETVHNGSLGESNRIALGPVVKAVSVKYQ